MNPLALGEVGWLAVGGAKPPFLVGTVGIGVTGDDLGVFALPGRRRSCSTPRAGRGRAAQRSCNQRIGWIAGGLMSAVEATSAMVAVGVEAAVVGIERLVLSNAKGEIAEKALSFRKIPKEEDRAKDSAAQDSAGLGSIRGF